MVSVIGAALPHCRVAVALPSESALQPPSAQITVQFAFEEQTNDPPPTKVTVH